MARAQLVRFAMAVVGLLLISGAIARGERAPEGLKRLDFLVGEWRGTSSGEPGNGTVERSCMKALNDRFIECRTTTTYPPQEKNKKGEVHVDRAFYSYDKAAKKLRLRQFHGEGFVNSYTETEPLVFVTVEIENIPQGGAHAKRTNRCRRIRRRNASILPNREKSSRSTRRASSNARSNRARSPRRTAHRLQPLAVVRMLCSSASREPASADRRGREFRRR